MRITHKIYRLIIPVTFPTSVSLVLTAFILISLTSLTACSSISYYNQSIMGQISVLYKRESIDDVINNPKTNEKLKNKLLLVKGIRHYASDKLLLPDNKSYLYYSDLNRPYAVWNVFAAPEFSLKPITWCYPILGCVSYKGYFSKQDAIHHAQVLLTNDKGKHNDTYVAGIAAYSTLGWFNDPLLNTMINWHERALAGLIFHELTHQILYISNETSFNEAFASSVERIGSIQWLLDNKPNQVKQYLEYLDAQNDFRNLLLTTRDKLVKVYASNASESQKRNKKEHIFTEMKLDYSSLKNTWPKAIHFDSWFNKPINNARFTSSMTYLQLIPAFYTLFVEADGDWNEFYNTIKSMEVLSSEERQSLTQSKINHQFDLQSIVTILKRRKKDRI